MELEKSTRASSTTVPQPPDPQNAAGLATPDHRRSPSIAAIGETVHKRLATAVTSVKRLRRTRSTIEENT